MSIVLFEMDGCHFCVKAKNLFKDEIASGFITIKPASQAPKGVSGFPFFMNLANGMTHTGFPGDKLTLYTKLQVNPSQTNTQTEAFSRYNYGNIQPRNLNRVEHYTNFNSNICPKCHLPKPHQNY